MAVFCVTSSECFIMHRSVYGQKISINPNDLIVSLLIIINSSILSTLEDIYIDSGVTLRYQLIFSIFLILSLWREHIWSSTLARVLLGFGGYIIIHSFIFDDGSFYRRIAFTANNKWLISTGISGIIALSIIRYFELEGVRKTETFLRRWLLFIVAANLFSIASVVTNLAPHAEAQALSNNRAALELLAFFASVTIVGVIASKKITLFPSYRSYEIVSFSMIGFLILSYGARSSILGAIFIVLFFAIYAFKSNIHRAWIYLLTVSLMFLFSASIVWSEANVPRNIVLKAVELEYEFSTVDSGKKQPINIENHDVSNIGLALIHSFGQPDGSIAYLSDNQLSALSRLEHLIHLPDLLLGSPLGTGFKKLAFQEWKRLGSSLHGALWAFVVALGFPMLITLAAIAFAFRWLPARTPILTLAALVPIGVNFFFITVLVPIAFLPLCLLVMMTRGRTA